MGSGLGGGSCYPLIISTFPFTSAPYEGSDPRVVARAKASAPFLLEQLNYPWAVQNVSPVMAGSPSGVGTTQGLPTTNPQPGR